MLQPGRDNFRRTKAAQRQQQLDNESRNLDLRAEELALKQGQANTGGYFMPTPGSLYQDARIVSPGQMFAGDAVAAGYSYAQPFQAPSYLDEQIAIPGAAGIDIPDLEIDTEGWDAFEDDMVRRGLELKASLEEDAARLKAINKDIDDPGSVGVDVYREYKDRMKELLYIGNKLKQLKPYTDKQTEAYISGAQRAPQSGRMYDFLGSYRLGALNFAKLDDMTTNEIAKMKEYADSGNIRGGQEYFNQIQDSYLIERQNRVNAFGEGSDQVKNIDRNIDALRGAYRNYYKDADLALKKDRLALDEEKQRYAAWKDRTSFNQKTDALNTMDQLLFKVQNQPHLALSSLTNDEYPDARYDEEGVIVLRPSKEGEPDLRLRIADDAAIINRLNEVGLTQMNYDEGVQLKLELGDRYKGLQIAEEDDYQTDILPNYEALVSGFVKNLSNDKEIKQAEQALTKYYKAHRFIDKRGNKVDVDRIEIDEDAFDNDVVVYYTDSKGKPQDESFNLGGSAFTNDIDNLSQRMVYDASLIQDTDLSNKGASKNLIEKANSFDPDNISTKDAFELLNNPFLKVGTPGFKKKTMEQGVDKVTSQGGSSSVQRPIMTGTSGSTSLFDPNTGEYISQQEYNERYSPKAEADDF